MGKPRKNSKDVNLDLRFTPPYSVTPLMELLKLDNKWFVWEPASGQNDLVEAIEERCPAKVVGTEIRNGQDFFDEFTVPKQFNVEEYYGKSGIITNPPYSIKPQWLRRSFEVSKNVALLLPVESLASSKLRSIWNDNGGVSILLTDTRTDFKSLEGKWFESEAIMSTAWFISGFGIEQDQILHSSIKEEKSDFKKSCRFLDI